MASQSEYARPSFFDISNIVPQGHEKALKQAFYNVAAILFVVFVFVAGIAVYYVLEPFLQPLLWAVLFGSVLHPLKHSLTVVLKNWLNNLHNTSTPLALGVMMFPLGIVDRISEAMWNFTVQYALAFISVISLVCGTLLVYSCVPDFVVLGLQKALSVILQGVSSLLEFCNDATLLVWSVVIGYLITILFWWTPSSRPYLVCTSPFVWTILICHLVSIAGSLRLTILLLLLALMIIGFIAELKGNRPNSVIRFNWAWMLKGPPDEELEVTHDVLPVEDTDSQSSQNVQVEPSTPEKPPPVKKGNKRKTSVQEDMSEEKMSNYYLYGLLWACVLAEIWLHVWLLHLLLIPAVYIGIKYSATKFGVLDFLKAKFVSSWDLCKERIEERKDALVPVPLRGLGKLLMQGDQKVISVLEGSIDTFTSIAAILAVLVFAFVGTIFIAIQIYGESVHLVSVTSSLINRTVHNTEIQQLVPESLRDVQGTLDTMLGDAYLYGREWISSSVRKMIDDQNDTRAAALEKQILEVFDRVYELYISRSVNDTNSDLQHMASFDNLLDGLKTLNFDLIINFVKENIGTLISVLDSVWTVLMGNISLAFSAVTALLSLVFGGGTAVLNFFLNFIVFSTSLFYLLCASGDQYKPVEFFSSLLPSGGSGTKFGQAVEQAINGVFAASFKMAAFYGLYTWLIHTLFDVKIIYIPSVLAALFGAVPFLGPYWACLPAVLELWLVNGRIGKACFMMLCQFIPSSFVDSAVYSEIKGGGHPYLTGLAIAGGVFCLGFEGALFGPMLLCVLFVAMNMYGSVMKPSLDDSRRASRLFTLKRMFTIE